MSDLVGRYFMWLCGYVDVKPDPTGHNSYSYLAEELFHIPFTWSLYNDDNREMDGLSLRDEFCDYTGTWENSLFVFSPCSVLEMLVALAKRADYESEGLTRISGIPSWFHTFLSNLDLLMYDDKRMELFASPSKTQIRLKITNFLDRRYQRDGTGGLFPLKKAFRDQRGIEIWYQLSDYIAESSEIDLYSG